MEPYLLDFALDLIDPGVRLELKFPVSAHVFGNGIGESKTTDGNKERGS